MSKIRILFFVVFLASGCAALMERPPVESDLVGDWISINSVPYAKLRYTEVGGGLLVFAFKDETQLFEIGNFTVNEYQFTVTLTEVGSDEEPEILVGTILGHQLQLKDSEGDEFGIWFVKSEVVETLKASADQALANYETTRHKK